MSLLRRLLEGRVSPESPQMPLTSSTLADWLGGPKGSAGVAVTPKSSLQLTAVYRCVALLAGTLASLPLHSYRQNTRERQRVRILERPHPDLTTYEVWELLATHLLLWGNCYAAKMRNEAGQIAELWPIEPWRVKVERTDSTRANPAGKIFSVTKDGEGKDYTPAEVFHVPGLGYNGLEGLSPIGAAREGIGLGLAAQEYGASFFGRGSLMDGILTTDKNLNEDQADRIKKRWRAKVAGLGKAHDIAVLDSGAKFQTVTVPQRDAQYLETRNFQVTEIARLYGIPPHMVGDITKQSSWGTGIEQQSIGFVVYTLRPWLKRIEDRVTQELTGAGLYAEYVVEGLLRGDSKTRAEFYTKMRHAGAMNGDEIRLRENLEPAEGGDKFWRPANMVVEGESDDADA